MPRRFPARSTELDAETRAGDGGSYDAVRRRLKERGYLTSHLDRFVLLPAVASRSAFRVVLGTAAKAALVVGPLLGGLLAAVLAWSERPLERWTDLPILWVYLLAPATFAVFALDVLIALAVGALAGRRGPRPVDPGSVASVAGLLALAYVLAVWWIRSGDGRVVEDLLFVLVALPVVVAIGRLAGLVSIAGLLGRTGDVPELRRRSRGALLAIAVMAAGIALGARAVLGFGGRPVGLVPFGPPARVASVLVIGIDGLEGALVAALDERGALPNLLGALERGATFPLHRIGSAEPAEVWTTIATGLPAEEHGVGGAGVDTLPGVRTTLRGALPLWTAWRLLLPARTVPASGSVRRAPALWEIASEHAGTAVVGWWATWPVPVDERPHGESRARYVVSDRVLPKLLAELPADRDTLPAALRDRLASRFAGEIERLRLDFSSRFAGVPPGFQEWAWDSYLIDSFATDRLRDLLSDDQVGVGFVYLPGLDILRHRLAGVPRSAGDLGVFEVLRVLELYVAALDERLAPLLASDRSHTVVVADRGRTGETEGFVAVRGAAAEIACVGPAVGPLDLAPLILDLMGFPASAEMPGRTPSACLASTNGPPGQVATYGRLPRGDRGMSVDDPEILERLRSLGYLR